LGGHVERIEEKRRLEEKPERKKPLRKLRCRWENNMKINLRDAGWGGIDWIDLVQDRKQWRALMSMVTNFRVA
jgi:hypothetical protein